MSEQRKHIEVVAAIIKKDNTILATQRGYGIITIEYTGYEKFDLTMHCYLCSLENDSNITLVEHEAAKWLSKDSLYSVDWLPADIDAVDAIYKRL